MSYAAFFAVWRLFELIDCRIVRDPAVWQKRFFSHFWALQHIGVKHTEWFFKNDILILLPSLCRPCGSHSSRHHRSAVSTQAECGSIARWRSSDWKPTKCYRMLSFVKAIYHAGTVEADSQSKLTLEWPLDVVWRMDRCPLYSSFQSDDALADILYDLSVIMCLVIYLHTLCLAEVPFFWCSFVVLFPKIVSETFSFFNK